MSAATAPQGWRLLERQKSPPAKRATAGDRRY